MTKLYWDTHYHFNNDYAIKTLTKLNSNKVIHIEKLPVFNSREEAFEYYTGLMMMSYKIDEEFIDQQGDYLETP